MIFLALQRRTLSALILAPIIAFGVCSFAPALASGVGSSEPVLPWQSPARISRFFKRQTGTLILSVDGVEFCARRGQSRRWSFTGIKTFDVTPRRFALTTYQNKGWHRPGDRQYRFHLSRPMPPDVAARLAELVGKPIINGDPSSQQKSFASIPARHRTLTGGTNGVLHFTQTGISYITAHSQGARSWRWADIQTLANPDPYHFRVGGYRETFDFELKEPMSQTLFDRLWSYVYARRFQVSPNHTGVDRDETESTE
ncbi:MAG: hypothetical protein ACRD3O_11385 [Terriglobia bacterium]